MTGVIITVVVLSWVVIGLSVVPMLKKRHADGWPPPAWFYAYLALIGPVAWIQATLLYDSETNNYF